MAALSASAVVVLASSPQVAAIDSRSADDATASESGHRPKLSSQSTSGDVAIVVTQSEDREASQCFEITIAGELVGHGCSGLGADYRLSIPAVVACETTDAVAREIESNGTAGPLPDSFDADNLDTSLPPGCAYVGSARLVELAIGGEQDNVRSGKSATIVRDATFDKGRGLTVSITPLSKTETAGMMGLPRHHNVPTPNAYVYPSCVAWNGGNDYRGQVRAYINSAGTIDYWRYRLWDYPVHLNKSNVNVFNYHVANHIGHLPAGAWFYSPDSLVNISSQTAGSFLTMPNYYRTAGFVGGTYIEERYHANMIFDVSGPDPSCSTSFFP